MGWLRNPVLENQMKYTPAGGVVFDSEDDEENCWVFNLNEMCTPPAAANGWEDTQVCFLFVIGYILDA